MTNPKDKFFLYAVAACQNEDVKTIAGGKTISKKTLSYIVISIDIIVVLTSLFFIYFLENNITANIKVNKMLTFETSEFSLTFENLPRYYMGKSKTEG